MVALSQLHADSGIHHVFSSPEGASHAEHGVFIGTVECSYRYRMGVFVVAVAGCHIPLVIRVEVQRVEGCQCCRSRSYSVHPVAQFIDGSSYVVDCLVCFPQLPPVDGVSAVCADVSGCYVGDFLVPCVDAAVVDFHVSHGQGVGGHTVQSFQVFGHADFQVVIAVGYDAEVVFCGQFVCVCNASDDVHLFVQFLLDDVSCIAAVFHAVI